MHRKIVGLVSLMLLVTATSVLAQGRQPQRIVIRQPEPMHKLEVSWYGGYSWTFSRHICGLRECGDIDLAMSPSSLVGFQSWLEAAPPGQGSARQGPAL